MRERFPVGASENCIQVEFELANCVKGVDATLTIADMKHMYVLFERWMRHVANCEVTPPFHSDVRFYTGRFYEPSVDIRPAATARYTRGRVDWQNEAHDKIRDTYDYWKSKPDRRRAGRP